MNWFDLYLRIPERARIGVGILSATLALLMLRFEI